MKINNCDICLDDVVRQIQKQGLVDEAKELLKKRRSIKNGKDFYNIGSVFKILRQGSEHIVVLTHAGDYASDDAQFIIVGDFCFGNRFIFSDHTITIQKVSGDVYEKSILNKLGNKAVIEYLGCFNDVFLKRSNAEVEIVW